MSDDLVIGLKFVDGVAVVQLAGELDLASASDLELVLTGLQCSPCDVAVDLSMLSFISSSGFAVLADARDNARRHGHEFEITCVNDTIARSLEAMEFLRPPRRRSHLRLVG